MMIKNLHGLPDQNAIKPKFRGSGRMVSDFVVEYCYLRLDDVEIERAGGSNLTVPKEARRIIEFGENSDGYWTNEKFFPDVRDAVAVAEFKYPKQQFDILWLFDQSSNHTARSPDALVASKMNVNLGREQPKMHDTTFNDVVQRMVHDDGSSKRIKAGPDRGKGRCF